MTATIEETDLSVVDEPALPCDYADHEKYGDGPAVWIITVRAPMACGCYSKYPVRLLCDGCWTRVCSGGHGLVYCRRCFNVHRVSDDIVSVERL